jgi:hypothetical protein
MILRKGQQFRCQNRRCRAEIEVTRDSMEGESNPRCCCGAEMKKLWTTPVVSRLEETPEVAHLFGREAQAAKR